MSASGRGAAALAAALFLLACGDSGTTATPPPPTTPPATSASVVTTTTLPSGPTTSTDTTTSTPSTTTSSTSTTVLDDTVRVEVAVEQGSVVGGVTTVEVDLDSAVEITVTADAADEVHIHGYDVFAEVAPGQPGVLELVATIPGIFEVELEGARLLLLELQVS